MPHSVVPFIASRFVPRFASWLAALPTQDCCCHRVEMIRGPGIDVEKVSAVVSELSSSKVYQIQTYNVEGGFPMEEKHWVDDNGIDRFKYLPSGGDKGREAFRAKFADAFTTMNDLVDTLPISDKGEIYYPCVHWPARSTPPASRLPAPSPPLAPQHHAIRILCFFGRHARRGPCPCRTRSPFDGSADALSPESKTLFDKLMECYLTPYATIHQACENHLAPQSAELNRRLSWTPKGIGQVETHRSITQAQR